MRRLKTTPWDCAQHLKTNADMVDYLDSSLAEASDDAAFLAQAPGVIASACAGATVSTAARQSRAPRRFLQIALE